MLNIIGRRAIFLSFSGILVLASIVSIAAFGLRPGIDFTGGTQWQMRFDDASVTTQRVGQVFADLGVQNTVIQRETTSGSIIIKLPPLTEAEHQTYSSQIQESVGSFETLRFESIGPSVGSRLRSRAIWAALLVLLAISLYIAFSFRKVSYPVKSWKYGIITLATLFHDVIVPTGVLALLGYTSGVEIDTNFVVALLVVMGFSVHDTIVVFDRIRENVLVQRGKIFVDVVNESVNQTIARSINTSLTLIFVLLAMLFVGAASLKLFVLIMLIGTVLGTYSSIFVASPLLTLWHRSGKNK